MFVMITTQRIPCMCACNLHPFVVHLPALLKIQKLVVLSVSNQITSHNGGCQRPMMSTKDDSYGSIKHQQNVHTVIKLYETFNLACLMCFTAIYLLAIALCQCSSFMSQVSQGQQ